MRHISGTIAVTACGLKSHMLGCRCGPDGQRLQKKPMTAAKGSAAAKTLQRPGAFASRNAAPKAPAEYDVKFVTTAGEFTVKVDARAVGANGAGTVSQSCAPPLSMTARVSSACLFRVHGAVWAEPIPGRQIKGMGERQQSRTTRWCRDHCGFVTFATAGPKYQDDPGFCQFWGNKRSPGPLEDSRALAVVSDGMDVVVSKFPTAVTARARRMATGRIRVDR